MNTSAFKTSIARLNNTQADFADVLSGLLNRDTEQQKNVGAAVAEIIATVIAQGDQAVVDYTSRFDGYALETAELEVPHSRLEQAYQNIDPAQRDSLEHAAERVRVYHEHQLSESWSYTENDGTQLGQKVAPLQRVGLYVPGGQAAYPSSVLMSAIPAKVAGVKELLMVTPTPKGEFNDMVLAAAKIAGVDRVFRVGGAQAIAALAYGTDTIPSVDKITGPGNVFVANAKKQVFGKVGIDMIAGPSEVLIIADDTVNPDWVAMDLFAQAEHDKNAQSIMLTTSDDLADAVHASIDKLLPTMQRKDIIEPSLASNGALIVLENKEQVIKVADQIAAEHLEIFTQDARTLAEQISHAGAIFIGPYSSESLGDYCAGPSHVLPTSGTARFSSPLGVYDFQKRSSIINVSQKAAQNLGQHASVLARSESLEAHAVAAEYRLKGK